MDRHGVLAVALDAFLIGGDWRKILRDAGVSLTEGEGKGFVDCAKYAFISDGGVIHGTTLNRIKKPRRTRPRKLGWFFRRRKAEMKAGMGAVRVPRESSIPVMSGRNGSAIAPRGLSDEERRMTLGQFIARPRRDT